MKVSPPTQRKGIREIVLLVLGTVFLILGAVGAVLPLLPTTPFLLLAAACYLCSSKKMYEWLVRHPKFGPHIVNFQRHRAISLRVKIISLAMAWISVGLTALLLTENLALRIFLFLLLVSKTVFMIRVKTAYPHPRCLTAVKDDFVTGD